MILDGYTEALRTPLGTLLYRPLSKESRAGLFSLCRAAGTVGALWLILKAAAGRVQSGGLAWLLVPLYARRLIGMGHSDDEDERNLREGVRLAIEHPNLARVSCAQCRKWWFDPLTCQTVKRDGLPLLRPDGKPPCEVSEEICPRGHWERPRGLSERNQAAYRHFLGCQATGLFPDDDIVQRNARVIREVMDGMARQVLQRDDGRRTAN